MKANIGELTSFFRKFSLKLDAKAELWKMQIFEINKKLLKIMGLSEEPTAIKWYKWLPVLHLIAIISFVIPLLDSIIDNLGDLVKASESYFVLASTIGGTLKFCLLWKNKSKIWKIFGSLQGIVDKRESLRESNR